MQENMDETDCHVGCGDCSACIQVCEIIHQGVPLNLEMAGVSDNLPVCCNESSTSQYREESISDFHTISVHTREQTSNGVPSVPEDEGSCAVRVPVPLADKLETQPPLGAAEVVEGLR